MAADARLMAEGDGKIGSPELLVGVPLPTAALEVVRFAVPDLHGANPVRPGGAWAGARR
jgi:hypothetical protein